MPLQNRVTPFGEIVANNSRGTFMGNRGGVLHNENHEIVRCYANRRWITCLLEFKERRRIVMSPHRYTELFFLDEAVALSAGHRPCAECRRERFTDFRQAWLRSQNSSAAHPRLADDIDRELQRARIAGRNTKIAYQATLDSLPGGCFVAIDANCYLILGDALLLWTPKRYLKKRARARNLTVTVLTPEFTVQCIRNGYQPEIHPSSASL